MKCDVAVIGGGAAGLACAVRLIRQNSKLNIIIIEAGDRVGKKLAATGNGQGNVTNVNMTSDYYFTSNPELVRRIALCPQRLRLEEELFNCVLTADANGRVYPNGRQASALVDSMLHEVKRGGVNLLTGVKAVDIECGYKVLLSDGRGIAARFVVICVGGKAQKQFKTDGSSYSLAEGLGHKLTPLYPSLVQLKTETSHIKSLKGIRVDCKVTAFAGGEPVASSVGDVIFTDYGVSGNAIFAISPYIVDKQDAELSLNFLPDNSEKVIADINAKRNLGYDDSELLSGTLHNQLGRAIIKRAQSYNVADILYCAQNFRLKIIGTLGFDYAQVTRGGVALDGVTDKLESRYAPNVFFAGEVLDVDGCCGGYNLHWAFASGFAVADEIVSRI